ncbi:MAG: cell division protein FtsZ [Dehalococcoidia bacterium]|nr:MAG: cell division protein FtsZ [Dehalococcoidia bacterium]
MKLIVIGFGQCGGRITDEFERLNKRAHNLRGIDIIIDTFAVNTDATDLAGLYSIKPTYQHRILIGSGTTHGHGVAKISEIGAEIAAEDADKVIDAMRKNQRFFESDAFLLVAGSAGGTGSGATPVIAKALKERFSDRPVYALIILPFEHEEVAEERALYNTAVCLKSIYKVVDAVILVDNQRYIRKDFSLQNNMTKINQLIVEPFFDMLCAGEEERRKNIGAKVLDAGDIIQTLCGWSAIGYGDIKLPLITFPTDWSRNFYKRSTRTHKGIEAMDQALSEMSIDCDPQDAHRALFLLSAPSREMNMELVKELSDYLKSFAPQAIIRNGDYPREKGLLDVTVILSELSNVEKVRYYYEKSAKLVDEIKKRKKEQTKKAVLTEEAGKDVPTLL